LSPRVELSHHELPFNFTISVSRQVNWQSIEELA
jgi:hypothetical protein